MTARISTLQQLHQVQLEALCELDRVCKLHDIRWFLHGGTLLGALRHGGPIPWDDDVDVAMLREDYDRFVELAVPDLDPRFVFNDHAHDDEFFDFVPRISDIAYEYPVADAYSSKFVEGHEHPDMDIFVFEPACDGLRDKVQSFMLKMNTAQAMGHRAFVDHAEFSGASKIASYVFPALGKRKTLEALLAKRMRLAGWGNEASGKLRVPNDIVTSMDFRFERCWYDGERTIDFGGVELPIPVGAEHELDEVYHGKWRELPPVEGRKPQHAALEYR